jgi:hypothetical protein
MRGNNMRKKLCCVSPSVFSLNVVVVVSRRKKGRPLIP